MNAIPVYTLAAWSGTGKTTFLERLVAELKSRGLRVAVIKHDAHGLAFDTPGKDTWRFAQAGADLVAAAGPGQTVILEQRELPLEELTARIRDVDLILTEGYKFGPYPKIGLFRRDSGRPLAGSPEDFAAIVTDTPLDTVVPSFPLDDPAPLAEWILARQV